MTVALTRTRRPGALAAVAGLAAALLLSGCGADTAGAAAVVGDQRVTEYQVSDAVAQVRAEAGPGAFNSAQATTDTVLRLTRELLIGDAAAREGVVVTPSQVNQLIATTAAGAGGMAKLEESLLTQSSVPRSAVHSYATTFLQQQQLGKKLDPTGADGGQAASLAYVGRLSTELDTRIAARYGTWDPATIALGPTPTDLASPVS